MTLIYDRHRSLSTHVLHVLHVLSYTGAMRTTKPSRTAYNTALGATAHILLFEHRMTRKQLAQHLGVAQSVISRKLRGQVTWTAEELAIMASLFDLKLDDITPVRSGENWVPAVWKPDMQKAPVPVRTEASGVVAGTGFEPATSGLQAFCLTSWMLWLARRAIVALEHASLSRFYSQRFRLFPV